MMDSLQRAFAERSPRERVLLLVMGGLALVVVYWLGLWRPLNGAASAAQDRYVRAAADHAEARRLSASLAGAGPVGPTEPARNAVSASAAARGLTVASLEPEADGGVVVSLEQVRPPVLFGWIAELEREKRLSVRRFSVQPRDGETLDAQISLGPPA